MRGDTHKTEIRLRAPLRDFMDARGWSVRHMAWLLSDQEHAVSASTVQHMARHTDRAVKPWLARRVANLLGVPYQRLFADHVFRGTRDDGPREVAA